MNLGKIQFMKGKSLKVKFIFMNFLKKFLFLGNLNLTITIIYAFPIKGNHPTKKVYILNKKIAYSMQKVFEYVNQNYHAELT